MYITTLFVTVKNWKQPRCPSMGEWLNKGGTSILWNIIQQ